MNSYWVRDVARNISESFLQKTLSKFEKNAKIWVYLPSNFTFHSLEASSTCVDILTLKSLRK
jgi:hypothetical protein